MYKDSILDELNAYSVLEYNLLRTADMEFPEEDRLILTMDETIIAKTRTDEIIEFLEKVICERCGMNLKIFPQYRKPQESKYRKNSEERIRQEVAGIVARTKLVMEGKSQETEEKEKTVETEEKTKTIAKTAGNRADTSKMVQIMQNQNQSRSLKSGESSAGNSSRITAKIHESGCNIRKRLRRREHGD